MTKRKNNVGFTQMYSKGWERVSHLSKTKPQALRLYSFLGDHLDPGCGAVVADQQFLADKLSVSVRTIRRWIIDLEEENALVRIPIAGKVCAYALDPYEVWKGYNKDKKYAAFLTKTLTYYSDDIQKRIQAMFSSKKEKTVGVA